MILLETHPTACVTWQSEPDIKLPVMFDCSLNYMPHIDQIVVFPYRALSDNTPLYFVNPNTLEVTPSAPINIRRSSYLTVEATISRIGAQIWMILQNTPNKNNWIYSVEIGEDLNIKLQTHSPTEIFNSFMDGAPIQMSLYDKLPADQRTKMEALDQLDDYRAAQITSDNQLFYFILPQKALIVDPLTWSYREVFTRGARPTVRNNSLCVVGTDVISYGGWDGYSQTNDVFVLDTQTGLWYKPKSTGILFSRARNNISVSLYI